MIGFVGTRRIKDLKDGRLEQSVVCRTKDEIDFWKGLFPADQVPRVVFLSGTEMLPNANQPDKKVVFQDPSEREQWAKTFIQRADFDHYAEWSTPNVIVLGSRAKDLVQPGTELPPDEEPDEEKWRRLSDAKLRGKAAEIGVPNIDKNEGREMLIARMKNWVAGHPVEATP